MASRYRNRIRLWPQAIALETRNGVRVGVWAGGPQPVVPVGSGTVAHVAPADAAAGPLELGGALAGDEAPGPGPTRVALHAEVASARAHITERKRDPATATE